MPTYHGETLHERYQREALRREEMEREYQSRMRKALTLAPQGFSQPPVIEVLAKFVAPDERENQFECELDGLVCHFNRDYDDDELSLDKVFANGKQINLDWLAEDFQINLMNSAQKLLKRSSQADWDEALIHEREAA